MAMKLALLLLAVLGVALFGRTLVSLVDVNLEQRQEQQSKNDTTVPILSNNNNNNKHRGHSCSAAVRHSSANVFSLQGSWNTNATLASSLDGYAQPHGCQKPPLPYPFEGHGCCSRKQSKTYLERVFVLDSSNDGVPCDIDDGSYASGAVPNFLEATRHKTVLFLGDSMTLQSYAGLAMELKASQIPYHHTNIHQSPQRQRIRVPTTNTTILLVELFRLDNVNRTGLTIHDAPAGPDFHVQDDELRAYLQASDIVITNFGLHHWGVPEYHYRQYQHVWNMVQHIQATQRRQIATQPPMCLIFRRTLPQHFATKTGSGHYGDRILPDFANYGCVPLNQTWKHPSDTALVRMQRQIQEQEQIDSDPSSVVRIATIDMTSFMADASAFHSLNKGDCSHLCYSPLIYTPMMYLMAETIRQACG